MINTIHICDFTTEADVTVEFEGETIRFDFSEMFGPLFLRKNGEPKSNQPTSPDSKELRAFVAWHTDYLRTKAGVTSTVRDSASNEVVSK